MPLSFLPPPMRLPVTLFASSFPPLPPSTPGQSQGGVGADNLLPTLSKVLLLGEAHAAQISFPGEVLSWRQQQGAWRSLQDVPCRFLR